MEIRVTKPQAVIRPSTVSQTFTSYTRYGYKTASGNQAFNSH